MHKSTEKVIKKRITGEVISDGMDKTIVVAVKTLKTHPLYKKRYRSTRKYKAHDPKNTCKVGDTVTMVHCRPLSAEKRWRVEYDNKANK
ncbi:30S ribosomal protein S17 [Patescibacteria group bacterium]|nr:30S ribosomal protein S17 [Patescibacteria group bacterium]